MTKLSIVSCFLKNAIQPHSTASRERPVTHILFKKNTRWTMKVKKKSFDCNENER